MICGDTYPIISGIQFPGLVTGFTNLDPKKVISKINKILERSPNFFQYIMKVIPIDFICETDTNTIKRIIQENQKKFINRDESFKITLKRRKHEKIERINFIKVIAKLIDNKVDLENPDKIIRIEVLGNISGISFLKKNEIVKIKY
ncbi:MAG: THUMP domain-containing protein [Promethearchaeota archaeon]